MSTATLVTGVVVTLATAAVLAYVGRLTLHRRVSPRASEARTAFAAWWWAAAAVLAVGALHTLAGLAGVRAVDLHVLLLHVRAVPLAVAVWGLLFYLLYVYTGRAWLRWPVAAYAIAFYVYFLVYIELAGPWRVEVTPWEVRVLAIEPAAPAATLALGLLLGAPLTLASVLYGSLYFRLEERTQRFRVALVSLAFAALFATILVGFALRLETRTWFPLLYQVPSLVAALVVLFAHRPPAWARERWRVEAVA